MSTKWPKEGITLSPSLSTALKVLVLCVVARFIFFTYEGYCVRAKFRKLQAKGIVIPEGHSLLFGHLLLFKKLRSGLPKNAHRNYALKRLTLNWKEYFPGSTTFPPVIYFDLWPLAKEPVMIITDESLCQNVIQGRYPPRHPQVKYLAMFIGGPRQLFVFDGDEHRMWRTRLNPGFSARNLQSHMPALVEEVSIFAANMKRRAGVNGTWGHMFPLFPNTVNLTFDIICRIVLDFSPGEQTNGPTELQESMRALGARAAFKSLANLHLRLNPFWQLEGRRHHNKLKRILLPHIQKNLGSGAKSSNTQRTVVQLAVKDYNEAKDPTRSSVGADFIDDVIGLTKQFIFAGHDTTAITLCFAYYQVYQKPDILKRLRDEHTEVFGSESSTVPELLRNSPHLLNSLPYTQAVIKEALRLYPVAASVRQGSSSFSLSLNGTVYPTDGFVIVTGTNVLHYNPQLWPRVTEFLPERWMVSEDDPLFPSTKYAFRPFEWGPMSCIGQELALMEMKMALLFTVRDIDVEVEWEELGATHKNDVMSNNSVIDGDRVYQTNVGLGPPTDGLPVHVRVCR